MLCPKCGKQIPDGSMFCSFCGTSFASQQPQQPQQTPPQQFQQAPQYQQAPQQFQQAPQYQQMPPQGYYPQAPRQPKGMPKFLSEKPVFWSTFCSLIAFVTSLLPMLRLHFDLSAEGLQMSFGTARISIYNGLFSWLSNLINSFSSMTNKGLGDLGEIFSYLYGSGSRSGMSGSSNPLGGLVALQIVAIVFGVISIIAFIGRVLVSEIDFFKGKKLSINLEAILQLVFLASNVLVLIFTFIMAVATPMLHLWIWWYVSLIATAGGIVLLFKPDLIKFQNK